MRGIRQWLSSAALVAVPAAGLAQEPDGFAGGTVVSSPRVEQSGFGTPASSFRPAAALRERPVFTATALTPPDAAPPPAVAQIPGVQLPVPPSHLSGTPWGQTPPECCTPIGAHGPIGQEVYFRFGPAVPFGSTELGNSLNIGWNLQLGTRAEYFDPSGTAAWALDAHIYYGYNNAGGQDLVFVRNDLCTIRALHRWAFGVAGGRDYFLSGPGFVGGLWDANARYGYDVGGRYGTGHIDAQPITDPTGYRRKQDVFGQAFLAAHGDVEVPMGAWTFLAGGRLEGTYTSGKWLVSQNTFYEVSLLLTLGVRY